ncbi:MAG: hypothetical protein NC827_09140 [Candidatus Omnitrophica bacterium]|nr:hypothetical protein [Candidatus Omnitrophota bacterium]
MLFGLLPFRIYLFFYGFIEVDTMIKIIDYIGRILIKVTDKVYKFLVCLLGI